MYHYTVQFKCFFLPSSPLSIFFPYLPFSRPVLPSSLSPFTNSPPFLLFLSLLLIFFCLPFLSPSLTIPLMFFLLSPFLSHYLYVFLSFPRYLFLPFFFSFLSCFYLSLISLFSVSPPFLPPLHSTCFLSPLHAASSPLHLYFYFHLFLPVSLNSLSFPPPFF